MSRSSLLGGIFGVRWKEGRRSITVAIFCVISPPSTCSHSGNVCRRVRAERRAPITCFSQDDSSVCGKALHPLLSHSPPIPSPPTPTSDLPQRTEKSHSWRRQLQNGAAARQGIHSLSLLPQEALSWVGGRIVVPLPSADGAATGPEMDGTMRRVLRRRACACGIRSMTHPPESLPNPHLRPLHPMSCHQ